jgi:S-(hydroxymethyl)glutathione dehydrogenase / alcohol dehydrogenase
MINKIKFTKAAILFKQGKPLLIKRIELPEKLFYGQVLIKNFYSGVCGSQLGEIDGVKGKDQYLPHLLGHEAVGIVVEVGPGVKKVKKNDNVLLHWMPGSGISSKGPEFKWNKKIINSGPITTFSEYSIISENRLTKINENLEKKKEILLLGCTTSTAIGATQKLANFKKGQTSAISGCGAIGLTIIKTLKYFGAKNIVAIDIDNKKLNLAKKFGANVVINSRNNNFLNIIKNRFPNKIDQFFECTGNVDVISRGFESLNQTGNEILIGVPPFDKKAEFYTLDINLGKNLIGCKGGNFLPDKDVLNYLKIMKNKKYNIKPLVTSEVSLNDINDVFSDMRKQKVLGKCIINLIQG